MNPRLLSWWHDNPADPDRPPFHDPAVQQLAAAIAPGARCTDLGGVMSLNVHLDPAGLVLRVHQPFVSPRRPLAAQEVRRRLAALGLRVPVPLGWRDATVVRCGKRWAEPEAYIAHQRLAPDLGSYAWLFTAMGTLHRALATLDCLVPRPLVATYGPPGTLRRWLPATAAATAGDADAKNAGRLLRLLVGRLSRQWLPASQLPQHLVHGDMRLSNVVRAVDGTTVYLDFGFLAVRPRIHDLAYALIFMVRALDAHHAPGDFTWKSIPPLIDSYEAAAPSRLTAAEWQALAPAMAAIPLYHAALAGFAGDPVEDLRAQLPFLRLSEWLLTQPTAPWA